MTVTKLKVLASFLIFPLISFLVFYDWAESLASDPSALTILSMFIQYVIIYGATISCNNVEVWAIIILVGIGLTIYGMINRSAFTFLVMNISLFIIFCLPIFLAVTGTTRFCMSFLI